MECVESAVTLVDILFHQTPVRDHMLSVMSSKLHSMGRSQNDMETAKWYAHTLK